MALVLNEEQRMLKDSARDFLSATMPVAALRQLRDSDDSRDYNRDHWQQMVELGWAGVVLPEQYGGLDFGYLGLGAIIEETGRRLAASPLLSNIVMCSSALLLAGSEAQKEQHLPAMVSGELTIALAVDEGNHHDPAATALSVKQADGQYQLDGRKVMVMEGGSADQFIVVARSSGQPGDSNGLSLFLIAADHPGLTKESRCILDSRGYATVSFDQVTLAPDALIGEWDQAWPILEQVLDRGRICLAAEMLGGALECFDRTVEYLKDREQFGVKIGTFQALQHRAAIMFTELELCKSALLDALSAIDDARPDLPQLASLAKTLANDVFQLVSTESIQMHGGIGVTDELDLGLFLKRCRTATELLGNSGFHRDRYASLCGY